MKRVRLTSLNDFDEWRLAARALLLRGTHPDDVVWDDPAATVDLFAEPEERPPDIATRAVGIVPPRFIELAEAAICHREAIRFGLLYRLLFRLQKDRALIEERSDPDVSKLYRLATEVRRDSQKMKAFVHFREDELQFAAWFEPEHYTLERTAPFFVRQYGSMQWAILTPYRSVAWGGDRLIYGAGARKKDAPRPSAPEDAWRSFFASIFAPAASDRHNLPDAGLIASLVERKQQAEEVASRPAHRRSVRPTR